MPDETKTNTTAEPDEVSTLTAERDSLREQHKSLQRELEKARRAGQSQDALAARLDDIVERFGNLESAIASSDLTDGEARDRIVKTRASQDANSSFKRQAAEQAVLIQEALADTDLDWESSDELKDARDYWKRGAVDKYDLAALRESVRHTIRAVKSASGQAKTKSDDKSTDDAADKSAKVSSRADKKDTSVSKPTPITLEKFKAMSPKERMANWESFKKAKWG